MSEKLSEFGPFITILALLMPFLVYRLDKDNMLRWRN
jgi:hypothetical protein